MDLRHLRYFLVVAEELHFTRAAQRLHIAQPPLSQQIRALEEELGIELFERNRRRVALTPAGEHFRRRTSALLGELAVACEETRRIGEGRAGELSVGFTSSLPFTSLLPEVLLDFRQTYPGVTLTLRELFTARQFEALREGTLDIGFVRYDGLAPPEDLVLTEIRRDPLRLVINARHPLAGQAQVALSELADEPFIVYPAGVGTGLNSRVRTLCKAAGYAPRVVQEAGEATTQIGLVAAGLGVAILPAPLECVHIGEVRYLPLRDEGAHVSLALATRSGPQPALLRNFVERVQAHLSPEAGALLRQQAAHLLP
ncbi:LysR family transcriptional regulator [Gulbenkiania mobilis]|uniref:LysR family transcriptional regulator n=1 Tax=Gulbenkiania mobilis TaxID=397457 RepID=UPI0006BBC889|nr:LysR family transcriptional regulator [Gulbenkiania mobilis]